ncbi:MAG TPA: PAS domain S-box protein [Candidatus Competibacter sp.]|nr:PAS domain S-box protein [Candidatus Competibacter sp.]
MKRSLSLALLYVLIAAFWIFGSDQLVLWLNLDPEASTRLQTVKGWTFVAFTALLLFLLLRRLETERQLESQFESPPRTAWIPVALFSLLVALTVLSGILAYREVIGHFGEAAVNTRLLAWIGFMLLFALVASSICILFWWQNTKARFVLERLRIDLERANLRHRYETLLRQSLDVVVLLAEDGVIVEVNDRVREYYGRAPEELRGRSVRELRAPESWGAFADDYRRVAQTGGALFERLHQRRDGTPFPVEVSARPLDYQERRYFQSVVRDISERKRTEAALTAQDRRFRATFEQAAVGMAHVAPDGHWMLVNDRLCAIIGYSRQELLQKTFQDITHPDDLEKDRWLTEQMLTGQIRTYSMEKRYLHKDGGIVWVNLTISLLRNAEEQLEYFIVVIDDITLRKRIEQRLARISRFYAALSLTNQAILRNVENDDQLFEETCRIAVKCGELKGAWIGLQDPNDKQLRVAAAFGELRGRLVSLGESIAEGSALPYQPAHRVLASASHWLDNDLLDDHAGETDWQILAATTGVRSCAAFPLQRGGAVIGAFSLYASEPEFFDPELVELLDEMAADVSFALDNIAREAQRRRAEQELRLAAAVYEQSAEGILVSDQDNRIVMVNRAFTEVTGYPLEEIRGQNPCILASGRHDRDFYRTMWASLQEVGHWQGEIWNRRKNGEIYPEWLGITALRDAENRIDHYIGIFDDVSVRKAAEEKIQYLAHHDPLTGLPNRILLQDRLRQALVQASRHHRLVAVLLLDLDRFKTINDSLGHAVGDRLLQGFGQRLNGLAGEGDTVCRRGGDEFVIVLSDLQRAEDAGQLAERILSALSSPFEIEGHALASSASVGISLFPTDGQDAETLLRNADLAMYRAKDHGRNNFQFFTADLTTGTLERLHIEHRLRQVIERGGLTLHYQPQIALETGQMLGMEALVRWTDPGLGRISPTRFVKIAEESGLIVQLGRWVLHAACHTVRGWQTQGLPPIPVAVNISALQFARPDFVEVVATALAESGLEPRWLELELTESILMAEAGPVLETLHALKQLGIRLSIDDFGTGYSSLNYLRRFALDKLKIDRSFVRELGSGGNGDATAIVQAIIALAKALRLATIAEGVETIEQRQMLRDYGCDGIQGDLISQPLPEEAMGDYLGARLP